MAGSSLSGIHPTIANLYVILTDGSVTSVNPPPILLGSCTGTPDVTANTFQKGCILYATDAATGVSGVYMNVGTLAAPVWTQIAGEGLANGGLLFVLDTHPGNNAINITSYNSGSVATPLVTGLTVGVRLAGTLGVGTSPTVNFNGTTKNLVSGSDPGNNLNTGYASGAVITMIYTNGVAGGVWQLQGD